MKPLLHPWSPTPLPAHRALFPPLLPSLPCTLQTSKTNTHLLLYAARASSDSTPITSTSDEEEEGLSGRERRRLRNARREENMGYNWKEEVEEKLLNKPKKKYVPKKAELNLDNLMDYGSRWWMLRISRLQGHETAELVARALARKYPHMDFKVYAPTIQVKSKLKNGTISEKTKPFCPGIVFLWCVMNKEIHDLIKDVFGVKGFTGFKVIYRKRAQLLKPKPVDDVEMERIFKEAKEEQEKVDQAFEKELEMKADPNLNKLETDGASKSATKSKPRTTATSTEASKSPANGSPRKREKIVLPTGSTVQVLSGKFEGFKGTLKKLNRRSRKATVSITLFGKESMVELDLEEIVAET